MKISFQGEKQFILLNIVCPCGRKKIEKLRGKKQFRKKLDEILTNSGFFKIMAEE